MSGSIFSIVSKVLRYKVWVTYQFLYAMRHNDANNMPFPSRPPLTTLLLFQIFDKILSFLKNVLKVPLNLNIVVDKLFSCVGNSWRKESQAEENRYLIWAAEWSGEHSTSRHTEYTYYFLISNCGNASNFLRWR